MNKKAEEVLEQFKGKTAGVFIDDGNIFHLQRESGVKIDWKKFKNLLSNYFNIWQIRYYRGVYPPNWKVSGEVLNKHRNFEEILKTDNYKLIPRFIKKIYTNKRKNLFEYKCDFDGEIGFDIGKNLENFEVAVIVSGDSDFAFLEKRLKKLGKRFLAICFKFRVPWEFITLKHVFFEDIKDLVGYQIKTGLDGPVKNTASSLPSKRRIVK